MTISVGDRLPDATFKVVTSDGVRDLTTHDIFAGKRVVLVGVPGAFTPTCSNNHLPGFIENHEAIRSRGVDTVAVVATNDHFVMAVWAKFSGGEGKIVYIADGNSTFIKELGLLTDMSKGALGMRSVRFSMLVEDGVVKVLNTGDAPGQAIVTGAAKMLEQLDAAAQPAT